jgi:hypothetical protein
MLAAGLVHLLNHSEMSLRGMSDGLGFPIANFVCGLSFILVFFVETIFSRNMGMDNHHMDHIRVDRDDGCFPPEKQPGDYGAVNGDGDEEGGGRHHHQSRTVHHPHHHHDHHHHHHEAGISEGESGTDEGSPLGHRHGAHHGRGEGAPRGGKGLKSVHTVSGALCLLAALW